MIGVVVIPNEGKLLWDQWAVNANPDDRLQFGWFANDVDPDDDTVFADVTPSAFGGFTFFDLDKTNLSAAVIVANVSQILLDTPPQFICTTAPNEDVLGWYLLNYTTSTIMAIFQFEDALTMRPGASITLDPCKFLLKGFVP